MSLKAMPHFTLPAAALADWIDRQPDMWWAVDGDYHLMSVLDFPCPSDELGPEIRRVGKDLWVHDKTPGSQARGEKIGADRVASLADTSNWRRRMTFLMSWVDSDEGWLLLEEEALVQT